MFAATNSAPTTSTTDSSDTTSDRGPLVQVSRLGNPLVNEAVVPANLKDYFNRSTPDRDGQFLAKVQDPEVPALIEAIYEIPNPNKTEGFEKRPDLVAAFLTDFSTTSYPALGADLKSLDMNQVSPNAVPAEYLRRNVQIPASPQENSAGVLGGDNAGFPNGRRLGDDVVDIALRVLEGALVPGSPTGVQDLGDGVEANDKAFLPTFPYVADADSGSDPRQHRHGPAGRLSTCRPAVAPGRPHESGHGSTHVLYRRGCCQTAVHSLALRQRTCHDRV